MLVARRPRFWLWPGLVMLLAALMMVAPWLGSETEQVRLRNALLFVHGKADAAPAFDWRPEAAPADFAEESAMVDPVIAQAVQQLRLAQKPSDWERVLAISARLLSNPHPQGTPIQASLPETYRRILQDGTGYCGDFTRVWMAFALASGMPVRAWSFSFDGFGGHGHVWPEVWSREAQRWQLVDIFDNVYFAREDGVALSALAVHQALLNGEPLRMLPLVPQARPGYVDPARAWAYYHHGRSEWYMAWGNQVFSYDQALVVRSLSPFSHALAQLGAVAVGALPRIRILADTRNAAQVQALVQLRYLLLTAAILALLGLACVLAYGVSCLGGDGRRTNGGQSPTPRVCVVGPLPPPSGGMGNQCAQLVRLLRADGLQVELVQTNAPYRPAWVAHIALLRAVCRLPPYVYCLWRAMGRCDVAHVLANSGWAWHLFAAPAIGLARLRGVQVIAHYHGGNAQAFLQRKPWLARWLLAGSALRVLPSAYLQRVFAALGLPGEVIPNSIDLSRFGPPPPPPAGAPDPAALQRPVQLLVSRNLEAVYDIATAIRAFARIHRRVPLTRLVIAGSGPELAALQALVAQLQLGTAVDFVGRIGNEHMAALLAASACMLNPSLVDNMPVSVLEALACGVPVVSTRVGGIPDLLRHGYSGLLVEAGDDAAMAEQVLRILQEPALAQRLREAGLAEAEQYSWQRVRPLWLSAYQRAASGAVP